MSDLRRFTLKFECPICGDEDVDDNYLWDGEKDDTEYLSETLDCDCGEEMEVVDAKLMEEN